MLHNTSYDITAYMTTSSACVHFSQIIQSSSDCICECDRVVRIACACSYDKLQGVSLCVTHGECTSFTPLWLPLMCSYMYHCLFNILLKWITGINSGIKSDSLQLIIATCTYSYTRSS